eukprot:scaffold12074_cov141-Isochrysis_galbana.AAC.2
MPAAAWASRPASRRPGPPCGTRNDPATAASPRKIHKINISIISISIKIDAIAIAFSSCTSLYASVVYVSQLETRIWKGKVTSRERVGGAGGGDAIRGLVKIQTSFLSPLLFSSTSACPHPLHGSPHHVAPLGLFRHRLISAELRMRFPPRRLLCVQRCRQRLLRRRWRWPAGHPNIMPPHARVVRRRRGVSQPRLLRTARAAGLGHVVGRRRLCLRARRRLPQHVLPPTRSAPVAGSELVLAAVVLGHVGGEELRRRGPRPSVRPCLLPVGPARRGRRVLRLHVRPFARRAPGAFALGKVEAWPALGGTCRLLTAALLHRPNVERAAVQVGLVQASDGCLCRVAVRKANKREAARLAVGVDGVRGLERVAVRLDQLEQVLGGGGGGQTHHQDLVRISRRAAHARPAASRRRRGKTTKNSQEPCLPFFFHRLRRSLRPR